MTSTWYAAFSIVVLLCVVNAVFLVATMRQVGVLHQRVRPIGAGQLGGPAPGQRLPALQFEPVANVARPAAAVPDGDASFLVMAYVTPGCSVCKDLLTIVHAFARSDSGMDLVVVTGALAPQATEFARKHNVQLPFLRYDDIEVHYDIPGSPYVLVVRRATPGEFVVLSGGVVNTMEQLETLVDTATANVAAFASQGLGPSPSTPTGPSSSTAVSAPLQKQEVSP